MAVVRDERHEGPHTRTKVPQVDNGNDGRGGEGSPGPEALGTGRGGWWVGVSITKTLRASQIITDHHRSSQIRAVQWETLALAPGMERVGGKLDRKRLTEALTARLRHLPLTL